MPSINEMRNNHGTAAAPAAPAAPSTTALAPKKRSLGQILEMPRERQFPAMLEAFSKEITMALPQHLNAERMSRLALTAFKQNAQLAACDPGSLFVGVILASQLGLELGVDGQCYLVPYKGKATFVPGWMGYMELLNRAGRASAWTGAHYKGDVFDYALGDSPFLKHLPMGLSEETQPNLHHAYAIGRVHDAKWPIIECWPASRLVRHRDRYNKVGGGHYSFANWEMYARKIVLLQVLKYLPKSVELRVAMATDDNERAEFSLRDVIEGEWSAVAADAEASRGEPQQLGQGEGPDGVDLNALNAQQAQNEQREAVEVKATPKKSTRAAPPITGGGLD
jgi:recombination protein RecT